MVPDHLDQFFGRMGSQLACPDRIDSIDEEPTAYEASSQIGGAEFVVADGVRDDVAHTPPAAQAAYVPLLRCEAREKIGELPALIARHFHCGSHGALPISDTEATPGPVRTTAGVDPVRTHPPTSTAERACLYGGAVVCVQCAHARHG